MLRGSKWRPIFQPTHWAMQSSGCGGEDDLRKFGYMFVVGVVPRDTPYNCRGVFCYSFKRALCHVCVPGIMCVFCCTGEWTFDRGRFCGKIFSPDLARNHLQWLPPTVTTLGGGKIGLRGGGVVGAPRRRGGGGSGNGAPVTEPLVKYQSPRREVVRSSAGLGVVYPPFFGVIHVAYPKAWCNNL